MYCTNCGREISDGAAYCGRCGMPVPDAYNGTVRYSVIKYDEEYAKQRHTRVTYGKCIARGLLYCMAPLILMFFGDFWMLISILFSFLGIAVLLVDCCLCRKYLLARQSAVVVDNELNTMYYVTLFGSTSAGFDTATRAFAAAQNMQNAAYQSRMAQMDALLIKEVTQFQAGYNRYNIWTGGETRVQELQGRAPLEVKKKYALYGGKSKTGRKKTIKIPDCFPGLKEGFYVMSEMRGASSGTE